MRITRLVLVAALMVSAAPALADPPPPPGGGMMGGGMGHGGMRGMFTPEERMMMFADAMKATAGMTDDQKQAYRHQHRQQLMAMSDTDRAKYKADLDARWAAMPADQKAALKAKIEAFMAEHHGGGGHDGQGGGQ